MLKIHDYEVEVSLGCSPEEQAQRQSVLFNVEIAFTQPVRAQQTDQLDDSINYVGLIEIIKKTAQQKPYNMIEHLCFNVTQALKSYIDEKFQGQLLVELTKTEVPIESLHGGATWACKTNL